MKRIAFILLPLMMTTLTGCGYLVVAGAGVAGGYLLKEKGYKIQSPVEKEESPSREEGN